MVRVMASVAPTLLTQHGYCIIVSRPEVNSHGEPNEDAVAAEVVNELMDVLGRSQQVVHAMDLRVKHVLSHVASDLHRRGLVLAGEPIPTPMFYSSYDNSYAKPGMRSLNLLLKLAMKVLDRPSPKIVTMLATFPGVSELKVNEVWGASIASALRERPPGSTAEHRLSRRRVGEDLDEAISRHAHMGSVDDPVVSASSVDGEIHGSLPKMKTGEGYAHAEYVTGMETYVDQSIRSHLRNTETAPAIATLPPSLMAAAQVDDKGHFKINQRDVIPRRGDIKESIAEARRKRTKTRLALMEKWKAQGDATAT